MPAEVEKGERVERRRQFVDLYERHYDDVLRYASRRIDLDQARDVTAETFLVAWRRIDTVPEDPLPWLYAVARRVLANHLRGVHRSEQLLTQAKSAARAASSATAPDHAEAVAEDVRIHAAMAKLSPDDQELLRLIAWEDLDVRSAAAALECSEGALAARLHRARKRLCRLLEGTASDGPVAQDRYGEAQTSNTEVHR